MRRASLGVIALAVAIVVGGLGFVTAGSASAADTSAPTEPGVITVSSVTARSASLKWGGSSDNVAVEGYRVYRGPQGGPLSLIATTDAVTSYSAANLRSGSAYQFGVVAIDAADNLSVMRTTTLTTLTSSDTTRPAAPTSTSVALKAFSSARIDVVWAKSTSTDLAYYEVDRDGGAVGIVELPNSQHYSDNGLAPSTSHSYQIVAVDSAGNRSLPTAAKSITTTAVGVVNIARGPYLSLVTATTAMVSWWTNIPTSGAVAVAGQNVTDPAGTVQHHAVPITGLSPDVSYPYTVTSSGVSAGGTIRTAASPGQSFSFAAIGDFGGQSSGESQNAANIGTAGTQFIQTLGDNIYPSAGLPDPNFTTTYSDFDARFYKQFGPVVTSQSFFPANGNKDYYGDGEFWANFPMPGSNHSWYSYNWGDAHILVLDSEEPFAVGTPQYDFAQADLAAHQNDGWRIVALQRPPYSSTSANSSSVPVRQNLVPLFQTEHVSLVLSGNSHNYERTVPLIDGTPTPGGITYVVSGAGGNGFNVFSGTAPAYTAFRESSFYEYAKVTVSPTALTVSAIRSDTNSSFDSTTIARSSTDTTPPTAPTGLTTGTTTSSTVPLTWTASSDNVGVTGYNVYRNGTKIPAGTGITATSFTDTGLAPNTQYTYTVTARDAAGNESAQSTSANATTGSGGGTVVTLSPINDSTIDPANNKPPISRLSVDASSPVNDLLVEFTTSCTNITAATLKLTVGSTSTNPSVHGGDFFATKANDPFANWSEGTVTWNTAPAKDATIAPVSLGAVAGNTTYSIDVLSLIPSAGGTFTIRGSSTSGDGAGYLSKEASSTLGPRLVLTCG
jgi:chitodextrinase